MWVVDWRLDVQRAEDQMERLSLWVTRMERKNYWAHGKVATIEMVFGREMAPWMVLSILMDGETPLEYWRARG